MRKKINKKIRNVQRVASFYREEEYQNENISERKF